MATEKPLKGAEKILVTLWTNLVYNRLEAGEPVSPEKWEEESMDPFGRNIFMNRVGV